MEKTNTFEACWVNGVSGGVYNTWFDVGNAFACSS